MEEIIRVKMISAMSEGNNIRFVFYFFDDVNFKLKECW